MGSLFFTQTAFSIKRSNKPKKSLCFCLSYEFNTDVICIYIIVAWEKEQHLKMNLTPVQTNEVLKVDESFRQFFILVDLMWS